VSADKGYASLNNYKVIQDHGAVPYIVFKGIHTGRGAGLWRRMYHYWQFNREEFLRHYHKAEQRLVHVLDDQGQVWR
jgi:hypothetical protein